MCYSNSSKQVHHSLPTSNDYPPKQPTFHHTQSSNHKTSPLERNKFQDSTRFSGMSISMSEELFNQKEQCSPNRSVKWSRIMSCELDRLINQWELQAEEDRKSCPYIWIEPSKIPNDWSNNPNHMGVFDDFCPSDEFYIVPAIQKYFGLPNPRPVMYNNRESLYLLDGGNERYYLYNDMSDRVLELYERNLDNILHILSIEGSGRSLVFRLLGSTYGPREYPGPWHGLLPPP